jgi:glycosyltransferase involved in cell wall biosynthesis
MVQAQKLVEKKFKHIDDLRVVKLQNPMSTKNIFEKKYSIIIPALNEEHTVKKLLENIKKALEEILSKDKFEIIVIDDGSTDLTFKNASSIEMVTVYKNKRNMGKGYSMRRGLHLANGKYIAFIDADGSHSVKDLIKGIKIIEKIEFFGLDHLPFLITGVRFKNGNHGTSILNKIGNKLYSIIGKVLWNKNINDLTCGLRFAKKGDLINLDLNSSRYTIEVEMIAHCLMRKINIIQMPIDATQRLYGSSGVRAMKEGIIIPISFILASIRLFSIITNRISI